MDWLKNGPRYDPTNLDDRMYQMIKISYKVINFVMKAMENWKVGLTVGLKTLAKVKIQRSIFQGDSLLPLICVIEMMSLSYKLYTHELNWRLQIYKITRLITKYTRATAKNEKMETLIQTIRMYNKEREIEFGIKKAYHPTKEKW